MRPTRELRSAWGTNSDETGYRAEADINRDGTIDIDDYNAVGTNYESAISAGLISGGEIDNIVGYDGYRFNAETKQYHVRFRVYDPGLERWVERDPVGLSTEYNSGSPRFANELAVTVRTIDGNVFLDNIYLLPHPSSTALYRRQMSNLYLYCESAPTEFADPSGMIPAPLIGCGLGGGGSALWTGGKCWLLGQENCVRKGICSGVGGCVAGGLGTLGPGGACLGAALGNAAEALCNAYGPKLIGGDGSPITMCDILEAALATAFGCLGGMIEPDNFEDWATGSLLGLIPGLADCWANNLDAATGTNFCQLQ